MFRNRSNSVSEKANFVSVAVCFLPGVLLLHNPTTLLGQLMEIGVPGKLIVGNGSTVRALSLDDQSVLWETDAGFSPSGINVVPDGDSSVVLAGTGTQTAAFDGATGQFLWMRNYPFHTHFASDV